MALSRLKSKKHGLIGVAILSLVIIVVSVIFGLVNQEDEFAGIQVKTDQTQANSFTVYTNKEAPVVTLYEDPLCPYCKQLERNSSKDLLKRVKNGEIQLEYKVVNILDRASDTGDYSSRVLGAYISILENEDNPEVFNTFHKWIYAEQPREGSSLSQEELITGMKEAGASSKTLSWYKDTQNWIGKIPASVQTSMEEIQRVRDGQVGVPTVTMNGKLVNTDNKDWVKNLV